MTTSTPAQPSPAPGLAGMTSGFGDAVGEPVTIGQDAAGTPCVDVPAERWQDSARYARDGLGMVFLDWLSAVDQPDGDPPGVDVVLHVAAGGRGEGGSGVPRMLLRTRVPESGLRLASLTAIWPGVAWHERETHEMFGVAFDGFDDGSGLPLRPLLLPEGFEGTPLRKSFVLTARASKPWPGAKEPGESDTRPTRRRIVPPGVPDPETWGPKPTDQPARPARPGPERPARPERSARPGPPAAAPDPGTPAPPAATPVVPPETPSEAPPAAERDDGG